MKKRKLGIIGGSGLYNIEGFENEKWKKVKTAWGEPSGMLTASLNKEEICFIPRHGKGHRINPTKINYRANIDALKRLGVTDIISVSAVGSLQEHLLPGTFVIIDQFIDRTFAREKTFFDKEIVAHVSMAKPTSPSLMKCCELIAPSKLSDLSSKLETKRENAIKTKIAGINGVLEGGNSSYSQVYLKQVVDDYAKGKL